MVTLLPKELDLNGDLNNNICVRNFEKKFELSRYICLHVSNDFDSSYGPPGNPPVIMSLVNFEEVNYDCLRDALEQL